MSLAILDVAARTALGASDTAFAAARARLSRPTPLGLEVEDPLGEPSALVGHPVADAQFFGGLGRRVALARPATEEVLARLAQGSGGRALRLGLVVASPGVEGLAPALATSGHFTAVRSHGVGFDRDDPAATLARGDATLVQALEDARALLTGRVVDRVVLVAVDAGCERDRVEALEAADRLKSPDNPVGLAPGDAAVVLLLGADVAGALARVGPWAAAGSPAQSAAKGPASTWVLSSLNGEEPSARAFADVLVRWRCEHVWHPVRAFGDTFGAHGALGLAWAVAALRRGYAPSPTAAVFSGDAEGATAIWVQAMPVEVRRG